MSHKGEGIANPIVSFWQRSLLDARVILLTRKFRKEFGIPLKGFDSAEAFEKWRDQIKQSNTEQERIKNFNRFENEAKGVLSYKGLLNETQIRRLLLDYYYLDEVDQDLLKDLDEGRFDILLISENKPIFEKTGGMRDGIYLRIGAFDSINQILKMVDIKKEIIRSAQNIFSAVQKLPKPPKPKNRKNFARDGLIVNLNKLNKTELRLRGGGDFRYKEKQIAQILKTLGFSKATPEMVKVTLQRRRKMTKALSE